MKIAVRGAIGLGDRCLAMRRGPGLAHFSSRRELLTNSMEESKSDNQPFHREILEYNGKVFRKRSSFKIKTVSGMEVCRPVYLVCDTGSGVIKKSIYYANFKRFEIEDVLSMKLLDSTRTRLGGQ